MNPHERSGYKRYLEPGSHDPVPKTTWHRFKKQHSTEQQVEENPSAHASDADQLLPQATASDNSDEVPDLDIADCERTEALGKTNVCTEVTPEKYHHTACDIINSLATEIDDTEISYRNDMGQEENEDCPDFFRHDLDADDFFDAIDDNDDHRNEGRTGEPSLQQGYSTLQEEIDSEAYKKPVTVSVDKSVGEIVMMILKFVLVHALSLTATTDLFRMMNCIFSEPVLANTRYLIDKMFYPKNNMNLYATCTKCGAGMGRFERKDHHVTCQICNTIVDVGDYAFKNFFVTMNVAPQISTLIQSNSEYYNNVMNRRACEDGCIRDIYDGKRYQEFVKKLNQEDKHNYATVTFNTDGAPLFESSNYSIWPIFIMVNELPYEVRSRDLILAGLWFGKDKPNMKVFLEPFVDTMNELSTKGTECTIKGINLCIKVFALICCVDAVARAPVQGFTQFNGSYGCGQCLHPGEWAQSNSKNARSGSMKYPLQDDVPKNRNMKETIEHMQQAVESNQPVFGVKCPSQLINLFFDDIIYGCIVDSMHCGSGIAKQFATSWFGNKNKAGLLPRRVITRIDALINQIKAPHQIVRFARSFSDKEYWKAREWENWVMFYSMTVLQEILPNDWLMHWALFVEALYILSKKEMTFREVDLADQLLREFVGKTELLYGKTAMTFNVHSLVHLARSVSDWGPLWSHNAYAFESGNGELLKVIHASKGVHHQICRRISLKYSFISLEEQMNPICSFAVKQYCNTLGRTMAKRTFRPNEIRYFGSVSRLNESWKHKLNLGVDSVAYQKMVKNSCLYVSALRNSSRSDNSFALLENNTYVKILNFIVDTVSHHEYTIVARICTTDAYIDNMCGILKQIVVISEEQSHISTKDIAKICVHMTVNGIEYLCAVPNLYYY